MSNGLKRGTRGTPYPLGRKKPNLGYPKKPWAFVDIQSLISREAEAVAPRQGYAYPSNPRLGDHREIRSENRRLKWTITK